MNYFEYFSDIEDRFSRRRGSILFLSTLDWALIETWREAGIPLEAVLRGIDSAFDKHDGKVQRTPSRSRKINGLAWCAQAVLQAAEELVEASTGVAPTTRRETRESGFESGFESGRVAAFLDRNASALESAKVVALSSPTASSVRAGDDASATTEALTTTATRLHELAASMRSSSPLALDDLDRTLTVLEDKLLLTLQSTATEQELVDLRTQADRELAPYRAKISATQLRQIQQQFLHKRLLELRNIPRLSLFYMGHDE